MLFIDPPQKNEAPLTSFWGIIAQSDARLAEALRSGLRVRCAESRARPCEIDQADTSEDSGEALHTRGLLTRWELLSTARRTGARGRTRSSRFMMPTGRLRLRMSGGPRELGAYPAPESR